MDCEKVIKIFNNAIAGFYSSRLIIVEREISKFLRIIAETPELYDIITDCGKRVSYGAEFEKAVAKSDTGAKFTMPKDRRRVISLVTGLLLDFDRKDLSIVDFVTKFYPADTSHESFINFLDDIITPYREAFTTLITGEPSAVTVAMKEELSVIPFPDAVKEDCDFWLRSLLDIVYGDSITEEAKRREFILVINGLLHASELRNPMLIKVIWIGLKNTFGYYKPGIRELKELESLLRNYGVIE